MPEWCTQFCDVTFPRARLDPEETQTFAMTIPVLPPAVRGSPTAGGALQLPGPGSCPRLPRPLHHRRSAARRWAEFRPKSSRNQSGERLHAMQAARDPSPLDSRTAAFLGGSSVYPPALALPDLQAASLEQCWRASESPYCGYQVALAGPTSVRPSSSANPARHKQRPHLVRDATHRARDETHGALRRHDTIGECLLIPGCLSCVCRLPRTSRYGRVDA